MSTAPPPKKLIEVALPLDEINAACKADKDRKTGTLRNLHKWFAPMPLPAWRALLFAAFIDDPADDERRAYLLDVIKRLVASGADRPESQVMDEAKAIIAGQYPDGVPAVLDPFCGGGSTLVEAQRLGLPTRGSDLNPVPALITRTLTSLLPSVYGQRPLHSDAQAVGRRPGRDSEAGDQEDLALIPIRAEPVALSGYGGLIRDVTHYAEKIRAAAWTAIGHFYATRPGETPVAWLWARTATCPNPTCGIRTPLTTSWWVSKKKNALAWIEPSVVEGQVHLNVLSGRQSGGPPEAPKVGRGASFACLNCGSILGEDVLVHQGQSGELSLQMTCVVAEEDGRRTYRSPTAADIDAAFSVKLDDEDFPHIPLPDIPRWFSGPRFGIRTQAALYTPRQLITHTTLADLIAETHAQVMNDGGTEQWATAVTTLLGLSLGKMVQVASTLAIWRHEPTAKAEAALSSHSMPMMWDFPEVYPFGESVGNWMGQVKTACRALALLPEGRTLPAEVVKGDARTAALARPGLVATDPPYFDTIGYADISDYFYVWHRRALRSVHPDLYTTIAAPKFGELTAVPAHHGNSKTAARQYFIDGFTETFQNLRSSMAVDLPMLVVYASKEQKGGKEEETRWSSILTAMTRADLQITGTWPVRGTTAARMISAGTNAVASYVVMVCRPRPGTAGSCSLNDFNRFLRRELKPAVHAFQAAGILPVDLAQAAMGPGMQVYSRYREVVDQSGKRVPIEQALRLISAALGEVLDEQEGELDPYSRFAVAWWERHHWNPAAFGEADQMARPQGITVDAVMRAGVVAYPKPGFVSVLGLTDMNRQWRPASDRTPTAWEAVHHLADRLIDGGGTAEAGRLMGELGAFRDPAQSLVYRLHDVAAKKNRLKDQERYNALIGSWSDLIAISATEKDGLF